MTTDSKIEKANSLLDQAYEAFRSGKGENCISLTEQAIKMGQELGDESIIGGSYISFCRMALRDNDEEKLAELSTQLDSLADQYENRKWQMFRAHMNAEMARMKGDLDSAEELYDQSMQIAETIGSRNMVAAECFNRSFISTKKKDFKSARKLIKRHFDILGEINSEKLSPYGLIALVYLLEKEDRLESAAKVAFACRRLFKSENIIPDPADEAPLKDVERKIETSLPRDMKEQISIFSQSLSCQDIVEAYLSN